MRKTIGLDIGFNWEIILNTVYQHGRKIPLLLKAGMGMEILDQILRNDWNRYNSIAELIVE